MRIEKSDELLQFLNPFSLPLSSEHYIALKYFLTLEESVKKEVK